MLEVHLPKLELAERANIEVKGQILSLRGSHGCPQRLRPTKCPARMPSGMGGVCWPPSGPACPSEAELGDRLGRAEAHVLECTAGVETPLDVPVGQLDGSG